MNMLLFYHKTLQIARFYCDFSQIPLCFFHPFFDLSFSFLPLYEQMILRYNKVDTVAAEQTRTRR